MGKEIVYNSHLTDRKTERKRVYIKHFDETKKQVIDARNAALNDIAKELKKPKVKHEFYHDCISYWSLKTMVKNLFNDRVSFDNVLEIAQ